MQFSSVLRSARLAQTETVIGPSPKLRLVTGAAPATLEAADPGTVLVEINLPADWLTEPEPGQVVMAGVWQSQGLAAGTAGHFRILDVAGAAHIQGTVGQGGADLNLDNTSIAVGQTVTINAFTLREY